MIRPGLREVLKTADQLSTTCKNCRALSQNVARKSLCNLAGLEAVLEIHFFHAGSVTCGSTCTSRTLLRRETATQSVLGDRARQHELQKVFAAAGLGADSAEFEAAEGLAADQGAGDFSIHIEVADVELTFDLVDVGGLRE